MITVQQYFTDPQTGEQKVHMPEHVLAASNLLAKVNAMLVSLKWDFQEDPDTRTSISGEKGGHGGGGFRLGGESGAPFSKHKLGHAVDVYDPANMLDGALTDELLEQFGLYREHPSATNGWSHLQDLPPRSGLRTFHP